MATFFQLTIDCQDPARLVAFWQPLLEYYVPPPPPPHTTWADWYRAVGVPDDEIEGDGADRLVPSGGRPADGQEASGPGVAIWFQPVPERKTVKNRLHLDLRVTGGRSTPRDQRRADIQIAVDAVIAAGGSLIRLGEEDAADHVFAVMADPEGNEFCLV